MKLPSRLHGCNYSWRSHTELVYTYLKISAGHECLVDGNGRHFILTVVSFLVLSGLLLIEEEHSHQLGVGKGVSKLYVNAATYVLTKNQRQARGTGLLDTSRKVRSDPR